MASSPPPPAHAPEQSRAAGLAAAERDRRSQLPADTDVLVIGGGFIGCALAYYLAREGIATVLLERGELNREASGTNAGSFHLQIAIHQLTGLEVDSLAHRLLPEIRLYVEGATLWQELEPELDGSLEMHVTGGLMVAETDDELALLHAKQRIEQNAGLETHVLEGEELRAFAPYLAPDLKGATYCPAEGHANPLLAAPLYALRASEAGAAIRTRRSGACGRGARRAAASRCDTSRGSDPGRGAWSTPPAPGRTRSQRWSACSTRFAARVSTSTSPSRASGC